MKVLLLTLLLALFGTNAAAGDRPQVEQFRSEMKAEAVKRGHDPESWVIIDTGASVPDGVEPCPSGLGDCPIVDVYKKDGPRECLFALHPKEPLNAQLVCKPHEPEIQS